MISLNVAIHDRIAPLMVAAYSRIPVRVGAIGSKSPGLKETGSFGISLDVEPCSGTL